MLDIQLIRSDANKVSEALAKRGVDQVRRQKLTEVEQLKAKRNRLSATIPQLKKAGEDATATLAELKDLSDEIKRVDEEVGLLDKEQEAFLIGIVC